MSMLRYLFSFLTLLNFAVFFSGIAKAESPNNASQVLFDDFNYQNLKEFHKNNWKVRDLTGHPGIPGATWSDKGVTFHSDVANTNKGILRMSSETGGIGENTNQTQICHERKYLYGTYAARVYFRNAPTFGPDGDEVIQTFYAISPLKAPMDKDYSEVDFEYLPNGGWGEGTDSAMWFTTWETFQLTPWTKVNEFTRIPGNYEGWHTLMIHVTEERVDYYVDGKLLGQHSDQVAPEEHMSINFNLWFMPKGADGSNGPVDSKEMREYQEDIDWVFHQVDKLLTPSEVESAVSSFRASKINFQDTVRHQEPKLPSPCGL